VAKSAPSVLGPGSNQEIIKLIETDGWYRIKARGGHRQYKHPTKRGRVTVPDRMKADLDPKTEKSILNQAGLEL
jgi:predicted RNA binding protein YcfA (HicA-like mRNA interferase family)